MNETLAVQADKPGMAHRMEEHTDGVMRCTRCNGSGRALPTECPGRRLYGSEEARVCTGQLDFNGGLWVDPASQNRTLADPSTSVLEQALKSLDRIANGEDFDVVAEETGFVNLIRQAAAKESMPSFVVIQEGGSSGELYVHAHGSIAEANDDRTDCARDGAYRTSEVVQVAGSVARLGETFYECLERVLASLQSLECIDAEEEGDDDTELSVLARFSILKLTEGASFDGWTPQSDPIRDPEDFYLADGDLAISFDSVESQFEASGFGPFLYRYQANLGKPWKIIFALNQRSSATALAEKLQIRMPSMEEVRAAASQVSTST